MMMIIIITAITKCNRTKSTNRSGRERTAASASGRWCVRLVSVSGSTTKVAPARQIANKSNKQTNRIDTLYVNIYMHHSHLRASLTCSVNRIDTWSMYCMSMMHANVNDACKCCFESCIVHHVLISFDVLICYDAVICHHVCIDVSLLCICIMDWT